MTRSKAVPVKLLQPPPIVRSKARGDLLEAASSLMRERDTLDISLSDIAQASGVNSALVKYYFGNKDGMLLALLQRDVFDGLDHLTSLMAKNVPPIEKMQRHISGLIRTYYRFPYMNRLLLALIRDGTPERAKEISSQFLAPIAKAYRHLIEEGIRSGDFRPVDAKLFYFTLIGACDQIFSARFTLNFVFGFDAVTAKLRDEYIEHTTKILMCGLLRDPTKLSF